MTPCIVGWAHTPFGRHDGMDVEALVRAVVPAALADAGVAGDDIDVRPVLRGSCWWWESRR